MSRVDDIIENVDRLPALPQAATRIIEMLTDGHSDLGEIEKLVRLDESISMTVLRYANSARFGRPGRVFNLKESIVRLGGRLMVQIVLEQQLTTVFTDVGDAALGLERGALWRGAMGGAFAAEHLADSVGYQDRDLCFLCGLLRDIGKLVMALRFGSGYSSGVIEHLTLERTFIEGERFAFGTDHAAVGAALATRWHLPDLISAAIRHHHAPPADPQETDILFDIVHAADIVCSWAGLAVSHDGLQYRLSPHARENLGLSRRDAEVEVALVWSKVREVDEAVNGTSPGRMRA